MTDLLSELDADMRHDAWARLFWALSNLEPGDTAITDALIGVALVCDC